MTAAAGKPPVWFWLAWPALSLWAAYSVRDLPTWHLALVPLVLGGLWLFARRRGAVQRWLASVFMAAVVASVVLLVAVPVRVETRQDLNSVTFGWPLGWLTQDLTTLDPPLPYDQRPATLGQAADAKVSHLAWAGDIALLAVPAAAVLALWSRRPSRSR